MAFSAWLLLLAMCCKTQTTGGRHPSSAFVVRPPYCVPKTPVGIPLNALIAVGSLETVNAPGRVQAALLNPDKVAAQLGGHQTRTGAGKGVENRVTRVGARQNQLGKQFLRLCVGWPVFSAIDQ